MIGSGRQQEVGDPHITADCEGRSIAPNRPVEERYELHDRRRQTGKACGPRVAYRASASQAAKYRSSSV